MRYNVQKLRKNISMVMVFAMLLSVVNIAPLLELSFAFASEDSVTDDVYGKSLMQPFGFTGEPGDVGSTMELEEFEIMDSTGTVLSPPATITKDTKLKIRIVWRVPDIEGFDIIENDFFEFELPEEIKVPGAINLPQIYTDTEENEITISNASIGTNGKGRITFTDGIDTESLSDVTVVLEFDCDVNEVLTETTNPNKITFEFNGEIMDFNIKYENSIPEANIGLVKTKTGYNPETNEISWRVVMTPTTKPADSIIKNVVFKDTLVNQDFVSGSFDVKKGSNSIYENAKFAYNASPAESNQLHYNFGDIAHQAGDSYTITFKTNPRTTAFTSEGQKQTFTNTALTDYTGYTVSGDETPKTATSDPATQDITADFIKKGWDPKGTAPNESIRWSITVNNNYFTIANAKIIDKFDHNKLGTPTNITLRETGGTEVNLQLTPTASSGLTYSNGQLEFDFNAFLGTSEITKPWTLSYTTEVTDPLAYISGTSPEYKNDAWLTQTSGTGVPDNAKATATGTVQTTLLSKPVRNQSHIDYATHIVKWEIEVNRNKIGIQEALVIDTLPRGVKYVDGSFEVKQGANTIFKDGIGTDGSGTGLGVFTEPTSYDSSHSTQQQLSYAFNGAISATHTITYETEVMDPDIYAIHGDTNLVNSASLTGKDTTPEARPVSDSATATAPYQSELIVKGGEYNHHTKELTWTVTINQNGMPMRGVSILDDIDLQGEKFTFLEDSVLWNGSNVVRDATKGTPGTYHYEIVGGVGKFEYTFPGDISTQQTISFTVKITDESFFHSNGDKSVKNKATLKATTLKNGGTADPIQIISNESTVPIPNFMVKKETRTFTNINVEVIPWRVIVNQNLVRITGADGTGGPTLEDDLKAEGDKLELDEGSVKLFNASVNQTTGEVTKGTEVPATEYQVNYNPVTNLFQFTFLQEITTAYILEFDTDIKEGISGSTSISNSISFKGSQGTQTGTVSSQTINVASSRGNASGSNGSFILTKVDKDTGELLSGGEFQLLDYQQKPVFKSGDIVTRITAGDGSNKGKATFDKLKYRAYYIEETKAPLGYKKSENLYPFTITNGTPVTYTWQNEKIKKDIVFYKVDEDGVGLSGATFVLEKQNGANWVDTGKMPEYETDGKITFREVEYGNYQLREIDAPTGYVLLSTPILVNITADDTIEFPTDSRVKEDGGRVEISNSRVRADITVKKVDANDSAVLLTGAVFALYRAADDQEVAPRATTDGSGIATFDNIPYGDYYVREITPPVGYQLPPDASNRWEIDKDDLLDVGGKQITVSNEFMTGDVTFTKLREDGQPLAGVEFILYEIQGSSKTELKRVTTGTTGEVKFTELVYGKQYEITETPLPGYQALPAIKVEITASGAPKFGDGGPSFEADMKLRNLLIRMDIQVRKTDIDSQELLGGAKFRLVAHASNIIALTDDQKEKVTAETGNNQGIVIFENIPYGEYTIEEVEPPVGYQPLINPTVKLTKAQFLAGNIIEIANHQTRSIVIEKVRKGVPDTKLEGAEFKLTKKDDANFEQTATTDAQGIAKFDGLFFGTYKIEETKAPGGYRLNSEVIEVVITATDKDEANQPIYEYKQVIENERRPSGGGGGGGGNPPPEEKPEEPEKEPEEPVKPEETTKPEERPEEPEKPEESNKPEEKPEESNKPEEKPEEPVIKEKTPEETPVEGKVEVPEQSTPEVKDPPKNGTVTVNEDGTWEYTPEPGFIGKDTFTIIIKHPDGTEEEVFIEIEVGEIPLGAITPPGVNELPKTGEINPAVFYILGFGIILTGAVMLRRSKVLKGKVQ